MFHPIYQTLEQQYYLMYKFIQFMLKEIHPDQSFPIYPPTTKDKFDSWKFYEGDVSCGMWLRDHLLQFKEGMHPAISKAILRYLILIRIDKGWDPAATLLRDAASLRRRYFTRITLVLDDANSNTRSRR